MVREFNSVLSEKKLAVESGIDNRDTESTGDTSVQK